jgi:hypothetical protein
MQLRQPEIKNPMQIGSIAMQGNIVVKTSLS